LGLFVAEAASARRDVEQDAEELEQLQQRHQRAAQQHQDPQELQVDVAAFAAASIREEGRVDAPSPGPSFLSAERSRSSSYSLRAANSAASAIVHSVRGAGERAKEAMEAGLNET